MSDSITVGLHPSPGQIDSRLIAAPQRVVDRVAIEMQRLTIRMQRVIASQKLEGIVLHHRTGRLIRSVHQDVEVKEGSVVGSVYAGKDAPYGMVHEYGGTFHIPMHTRQMTRTWTELRGKSRRKVKAEGALVMVRAYDVTYPERSFMRSTLAEFKETFFDRMAHAMRGLGGMQANGS